ncbi:hypothetical protein IFM89_035397, partial [Coptis chinensis]
MSQELRAAGRTLILLDQGKVHNKVACVADEKASQEIFEVRLVSLKETVQILRVITGCGTHGVGKGKLKQSVISLVEKGGIKWTEENKGIVLINLDGQKSFIFEESEDES